VAVAAQAVDEDRLQPETSVVTTHREPHRSRP
jgi:hypothetical protein